MSEQHIKLPEGSIEKTTSTLNLGPTHPATHGVFQNILELDGERIVSAEQTSHIRPPLRFLIVISEFVSALCPKVAPPAGG